MAQWKNLGHAATAQGWELSVQDGRITLTSVGAGAYDIDGAQFSKGYGAGELRELAELFSEAAELTLREEAR